MRKGLSLTYRDAIKLLATDEQALHRLDEILGLGLLGATPFAPALVIPLFEVKGELVHRLTDLTAGVRNRVLKASDFDRESLLIAAHAVIVIASFMEDLAARLTEIDAAGRWRKEIRSWDVSRHAASLSADRTGRHVTHFGQVVDWGRRTIIEPPTPTRPMEKVTDDVRLLYQELARHALSYVRGLARWDKLDETNKGKIAKSLTQLLPKSAVQRYRSNYVKLAADVPEFLAWVTINDHQATRKLVSQLLASHGREFRSLEQRLRQIERDIKDDSSALAVIPTILDHLRGSSADLIKERPSSASSILRDHHSLQQLALGKPLLKQELTEGLPGLILPSVVDGYINPRFRITEVEASSGGFHLAEENWWSELSVEQIPFRPIRTGIAAHLVSHLTTPRATSVPLVVLGHPGSGKSLFSKVIAAQLPPERYLVVRVELRHVDPSSTVAEQVDASLRRDSNGKHGWRQLRDEADLLTTVIVLDGFDELLQLSGQEDLGRYLDRVQDFQEKEATLGHPTAAMVTARTLVMDRVFVPPGTVVLKLEDFDDSQIKTWLSVWNQVNKTYFVNNELQPCSLQAVTQHRHLASQPLLLTMLALYDADDNALYTADRLTQVDLYERLFRKFSSREVTKWPTAATRPDELERQIDERLNELSAIAIGLFNRGRKFISREQVERDLSQLGLSRRLLSKPDAPNQVTPDMALGQFFFLYRAEILDSQENLRHGYEFLHATFGEFLVARALTRALTDVGAFLDRPLPMDAEALPKMITSHLSPYLAYRPMVAEKQLIIFIGEMCASKSDKARLAASVLSSTLGELLFEFRWTMRYRPREISTLAATAVWSLNLLLVTLIAQKGQIRLTSDVLGPEPLAGWRMLVRFWKSQLEPDDWDATIQCLSVVESQNPSPAITLSLKINPEDISIAAAGKPAGADAVRLFLEARLTSDRILEAFATFWTKVVEHAPAGDTLVIARALSFAVGDEIDPERLLIKYMQYLKLQEAYGE